VSTWRQQVEQIAFSANQPRAGVAARFRVDQLLPGGKRNTRDLFSFQVQSWPGSFLKDVRAGRKQWAAVAGAAALLAARCKRLSHRHLRVDDRSRNGRRLAVQALSAAAGEHVPGALWARNG
jgi:hypothetical protein